MFSLQRGIVWHLHLDLLLDQILALRKALTIGMEPTTGEIIPLPWVSSTNIMKRI